MGGITLTRSEFLVLMDAVQAPGVVGLDARELVPRDPDEHKALVASGIDQLKERGVLHVQDGINVLDTSLLGMAMVIADPELALITTRDTPEVGAQLFLHYRAGDIVVEQTLPSDDEHRLALLGTTELLDRILEIFPMKDLSTASDMRAILGQQAFVEVKGLVEAGKASKAARLLVENGVEPAVGEAFLSALTAPEFGGTLALLRCEKGEVVDGRDLAVVQGVESSWLVRAADSGADEFELLACDKEVIRSLLSEWIGELSA
jgi:hypothetical protein